MANVIAGLVLLVIVALAVRHLVRAKKSGQKCIGCPSGCSCGKEKKSCCCDQS